MSDHAPSGADGQREALLDGAAQVFASLGYEATTVRQLEEATGSSRGELFQDYHGKRELYLAAIQRQQLEGLVPAVARAMTQASSAPQLLDEGLAAIRAWQRAHPEAMQLFLQVRQHQTSEPDLAQLEAQMNQTMTALLVAVVGILQRRGILNDALEASAILEVVQPLMQRVQAGSAHLSEEEAEDFARPIFRALLEGIAPGAKGAGD